MSCMPYVAMGATFMVNNFRAAAMDSRFGFFISTVALIALTALSSMCLELVGQERNSKVFVTFEYFHCLSPTGEYVCAFQVSSFSEF